MLSFISGTVGAILLAVGVIGLLWRNKITDSIGSVGKIVGLKKTFVFMLFIVVGIIAGGIAVIGGTLGGATASITGTGTTVTDGMTAGALTLIIHDGLSNVTTTEDYYNDEDTFLTFYSADASILDGEEYIWNITIERSYASEDAVFTISCNVPDKELSGVTADNIAEKTGGEIDLDINDGGTHSDDNTVYKKVAMAEGTVSTEVQVAFDQEETYHDGMTDLDDYVDAVCVVTADDGSSSSVTTRIYADS